MRRMAPFHIYLSLGVVYDLMILEYDLDTLSKARMDGLDYPMYIASQAHGDHLCFE